MTQKISIELDSRVSAPFEPNWARTLPGLHDYEDFKKL